MVGVVARKVANDAAPINGVAQPDVADGQRLRPAIDHRQLDSVLILGTGY
jgi:hypothetical protein